MTIKLPEDKLDIIKLVTTQHIKHLNETQNAGLDARNLTIQQLAELLGIARPESGADDSIPIDEEPEGWLCNVDNVCGVN